MRPSPTATRTTSSSSTCTPPDLAWLLLCLPDTGKLCTFRISGALSLHGRPAQHQTPMAFCCGLRDGVAAKPTERPHTAGRSLGVARMQHSQPRSSMPCHNALWGMSLFWLWHG